MQIAEKYDVIYKKGQPSAVIIGLDDFEDILEKIDDQEDLDYIRKIKSTEEFRNFNSFLEELKEDV